MKGADKKLDGAELNNLKVICNSVIEYIKDKFDETTVRLKYEHFNNIFCKTMAKVIFEKLQMKNTDIKQLQSTCYKVMKEQLFSYIYMNIYNIL